MHKTPFLLKSSRPNHHPAEMLQSLNRAWERAMGSSSSRLRRRHQPPQKYRRAIIKGNFVRLRVVPPQPPPPTLPKLPPAGPGVMPKAFENVVVVDPPGVDVTAKTILEDAAAGATDAGGSTAAAAAAAAAAKKAKSFPWWERVKAWLGQNGAVLILNFGSMCTLVGFTRSDVLDLRVLSMTGSLSFVAFEVLNGLRNPSVGIRWPPVAWSILFASVNGYNIAKILVERKAQVDLEEHEEQIYVEHFMPHGVTPKQFHKALLKSKNRIIKKGETIITQGAPIKSVFLIVSGKTRAFDTSGRRFTSLSSSAGNHVSRQGGDSGAWVGEMAFLEVFWQKETKSGNPRLAERAMYSILAESDCEVVEWTHKDLEDVMHMSTDMRAAMTRAMTAAIVGKVINFTVSKSAGTKALTSWLKDWRYKGGVDVKVAAITKEEEADDVDMSRMKQDLAKELDDALAAS